VKGDFFAPSRAIGLVPLASVCGNPLNHSFRTNDSSETLCQACSPRCLRNTPRRSRSSTESQLVD
jgi:hypothetical protein